MARFALVLLGLMLASSAFGQGSSYIGMFTDQSATDCDAPTVLYTTTTVHFLALLDTNQIPSLSAVQFRVSNWPAAGLGLITQTWNTPLVIGEPSTDLALAFTVPLQGPLVYLGKVDFFPLNTAWIGSNYFMQVVPAASQDAVIIVRGSDATEFEVPGGPFTFNCTGVCPCQDGGTTYVAIESISPNDGSTVEGLFPLEFRVSSLIGGFAAAFTGGVSWDGVPVTNFMGAGIADYTFYISTQGDPHGSSHSLRIWAQNAQESASVYNDYTIADGTPPSASLVTPPDEYQSDSAALTLEAVATDFQGPTGLTAEFYLEALGSTEPTTPPVLVLSSDDGTFAGNFDLPVGAPSAFDIGLVVTDTAGNRSPYVAHRVYFYPLSYRVTANVSNGIVHDFGAVAGVLEGASDGYDPLIDVPEPPTPPLSYVSCYFPHDDWDSPFGHRFNADVRAATDFMGLQKVWDFTVSTDLLNEPFTMSFTADPAFIDSLPTYIHDLEADAYYNLHEVTQFDFNSGASGARHFQLVIGPSEALPGVVAADFASGWNLLGLPLLPVDPGAGLILGDDVGSSYFLYDYSEDSGYLPVASLDLNIGYWLGLFAPATIDVSGSAQVDTLAAVLADPWQMVGTGLYKNLALDKTRVRHEGQTLLFNDAVQAGWISPAVYGWNPAQRVYAAADTLELWRGYWVGQLVDGAELLFHKDWGYIPVGRPSTPPDPVITWRIGFEASTSNATERAYLGGHSLATRGFDVPFDFPKPPVAPGGGLLYMSFAHPDWRCVLGDHFNRDIRALAPDGQAEVWTLRVATTQESTLLTWPYWEGGVPEDYAFILDDLETPANEHIDMREATSYRLLGAGVHHLLITAGSNLITPSDELLPQANALLGVHPNPFNPTTTISFALREAALIELAIYGIDGRRVASLINARMDAGRHEWVWSGIADSGRSAPSGIYFAHLRIGEETFGTKLVLLK